MWRPHQLWMSPCYRRQVPARSECPALPSVTFLPRVNVALSQESRSHQEWMSRSAKCHVPTRSKYHPTKYGVSPAGLNVAQCQESRLHQEWILHCHRRHVPTSSESRPAISATCPSGVNVTRYPASRDRQEWAPPATNTISPPRMNVVEVYQRIFKDKLYFFIFNCCCVMIKSTIIYIDFLHFTFILLKNHL